jgi:hypothetical protein
MCHGRLLTTPPVPVSAVVLGGSDRCALAKQSPRFRAITEGRRDKFPRHSRTRPPRPICGSEPRLCAHPLLKPAIKSRFA